MEKAARPFHHFNHRLYTRLSTGTVDNLHLMNNFLHWAGKAHEWGSFTVDNLTVSACERCRLPLAQTLNKSERRRLACRFLKHSIFGDSSFQQAKKLLPATSKCSWHDQSMKNTSRRKEGKRNHFWYERAYIQMADRFYELHVLECNKKTSDSQCQ